VKAAGELRKAKGKSLQTSEWSERDGLLCFRDHIYVPNDLELRRRITSQHHDTKVAGHPGRWKTLELISRNTGGPKCLGMLVSIRGHAISVSGPRSNVAAQPESSTRFLYQRAAGTLSVWTSSENSLRCMDMMPS